MADRVISVLLRAVTGQYKRDMVEASQSTSRFDATASGSTRTMSSFTDTIAKAGAYTYGMKKAFDASVGAAISWESAFAGVKKTVDGTPEQLASIEAGLRAMSRELPTSASELANIAASAGQLGIQTDSVLEFTRVVADLGETTNLSGEQAATQLARLANITGMAQSDFGRLGSTVVDLGNNLATTESEIVSMGLRIAGAGRQVGLTEAQILGLSGALSSVGIEAEAGGSAISKVMIDIANEVETSGDNLATFARVAGMSAQEFSEAWRTDAAGALTAFISGLGRMDEQGQSTLGVLGELGIEEVRMRDALLRTSAASDVLTSALGIGAQAWEENTALTAEAAQRYDTTASNISELGNTFADLGRSIGEEYLPALNQAVDGMNRLANAGNDGATVTDMFADAVGKLPSGLNLVRGGFERLNTVMSEDASLWDKARALVDQFGYTLGGVNEKTDQAARANEAATSRLEGQAAAFAATSTAAEGNAEALRSSYETTEQATEATEELTEAQKALESALSSMDAPLEAYQSAVQDLAEQTAESTADTSDSWSDFADDVDVSITEVNRRLADQISAQVNWERNLVTIAERAGSGVALALAQMGEEGVGLVAELVTGTDAELAEFAALLETRMNQGGEAAALSLEDKLLEAGSRGTASLEVGLDGLDARARALLSTAGEAAADGFAQGIANRAYSARLEAEAMAYQAREAVTSSLQIRSPSRVFYEFGEQTVAGYVQGLEDGADDVETAVADLIDQALGGVDAILGGFGAVSGRNRAQRKVSDIEDEMADLRDEIEAWPDTLAKFDAKLQRAANRDRKVTAEEQRNIDRARVARDRAARALAEAQSAEEADALDVEAAVLSLADAEQRLLDVQREATANSRETEQMMEDRAELFAEHEERKERLLELEEEHTEALLDAIDAEAALLESGQDLIEQGPEGEELFRKLAEAAGLTKAQIDALIASYRELAAVATGQQQTTSGQVTDARDASLRAALDRAGVGYGTTVDAADIAAGLRAIGHDYGTTVDPEDVARLVRYGGARASGGPVDASSMYLVGEDGPEWFMPDRSGYIFPSGSMPGPTYQVTVPLTQTQMTPDEFRRVMRQVELAHG